MHACCLEVACVFSDLYQILITKTYQFNLGVKNDNSDTCKTANIRSSGREILPSGLQRVAAALVSV
jgi:hypothetical protein